MPVPPPPPRKGKRKPKAPNQKPSKKRKTKGKGREEVPDSEEDALTSTDEDNADLIPQRASRSRRAKKPAKDPVTQEPSNVEDEIMGDAQGDPDVAMAPPEPIYDPPPDIPFDLEIEEEEKPKPILQVRYQGFNIFGNCLCVVVEPWPPLRRATHAPPVVPDVSRPPSMAPPERAPVGRWRSETPLFLPEYDEERERSVTPAPRRIPARTLPPVPLFDDEDSYGDAGGMMEFSQVLNSGDGYRAGAIDDDEDMEGAVFFGDADEVKELS